MKKGAIPSKSRVRPLNPVQEDNLQKPINEWVVKGVIEPLVSLWDLLLVPVKNNARRRR